MEKQSGRPRVLVVEDEQKLAGSIESQLDAAGYDEALPWTARGGTCQGDGKTVRHYHP